MKIHNYDTELEELNSCPFCGGRPTAHLIGNSKSKSITIVVKCKKCNIEMKMGAIHKTIEWLEEIVIKKWNSRVN